MGSVVVQKKWYGYLAMCDDGDVMMGCCCCPGGGR